ncbi:hypothetical protein BDZ45DRAFT_322961 [Acephala macrosclerotiorum]|nr:hypothetical protein BDZ45DRAFT_322961 [Acephala macrosclerotiorum]
MHDFISPVVRVISLFLNNSVWVSMTRGGMCFALTVYYRKYYTFYLQSPFRQPFAADDDAGNSLFSAQLFGDQKQSIMLRIRNRRELELYIEWEGIYIVAYARSILSHPFHLQCT